MKTELILVYFLASSVFADPGFRPQGCEQIQKVEQNKRKQATSGVYKVFPPIRNSIYSNGVEVFCDMETEAGGWTVIQRRKESESPQFNFYRNWTEYASGFGLIEDSFWLGLDLISELTHLGNFNFRVEMMNWEGEERYAGYTFFRVANSTDNYRLTISGYSGTAGDSLAYHNGMQFSTKDRDNDNHTTWQCAQLYEGAWWYKSCYESNLNGIYGQYAYYSGVNWDTWRPIYYYSLKRVEMKIRRDDTTTTTTKQTTTTTTTELSTVPPSETTSTEPSFQTTIEPWQNITEIDIQRDIPSNGRWSFDCAIGYTGEPSSFSCQAGSVNIPLESLNGEEGFWTKCGLRCLIEYTIQPSDRLYKARIFQKNIMTEVIYDSQSSEFIPGSGWVNLSIPLNGVKSIGIRLDHMDPDVFTLLDKISVEAESE